MARKHGILLVGVALLVFCAFVGTVSAATTWYVDDGGAADFTTIQEAVNYASAGDTIIVRNGTYNENVDVSEDNLTIRSEKGPANCVVNAFDQRDHVFEVTADYVNITGFTVRDANDPEILKAGIYLGTVANCTISENTASNNRYGIYLESSSNNTLTGNTAPYNTHGIYLSSSSNNTLTGNTANTYRQYGIHLESSSNNTLTSNTASNNRYGIYLSSSSNNTLTSNTANSNKRSGIWLLSSSSNNTLTSNTANSNELYGIYLRSSSNNTIICNWVHHNTERGFYLTRGSTNNTIEKNNIMVNGIYNEASHGYEYNFYNDQSDAVEAKNNYWMAWDNDTIDASIFDYDDDNSKGKVTFYQFATGPVPCAPIPELPTVLLVSIGLVALAGYAWVRRKTNK